MVRTHLSGAGAAVGGEAPRPRPTTTRKRQAILDAARAVFARMGYAGASIEVIAG